MTPEGCMSDERATLPSVGGCSSAYTAVEIEALYSGPTGALGARRPRYLPSNRPRNANQGQDRADHSWLIHQQQAPFSAIFA